MPQLLPQSHPIYLQAAVFNLLDTCAVLQKDLAGYYRTAALEKVNGIEHVFRWFQKRQVKVCLLSDLNREDTHTVLNRLGWTVGDEQEGNKLIDIVLLVDRKQTNPIRRILDIVGDLSPRQLITIGDTPEILQWSWTAGTLLNLGVTYGSSPYQDLAPHPHHGLLDTPLEIPQFVLQHLSFQDEEEIAPRRNDIKAPQRLRLRLPFRFLAS